MNKHRRLGDTEINLTPLLDVLFTILFIVMLGGAQYVRETEEEAKQQIEQSAMQVTKLEEQLGALQEELAKLEGLVEQKQQQLESFEVHREQALVITLQNIAEDGEHKLVLSKGNETADDVVIAMGVERLQYAGSRIQNYVSEAVAGHEGQPVYIVFYCDKSVIYTAEYQIVEEKLQKLQQTYKEVFYKVMEGEDTNGEAK